MTASTERRSQPVTLTDKLPGEDGCASRAQLEWHMARVRRIGRQLFDGADCVVMFRDGCCEYPLPDAWRSAAETFCGSLPHPEGVLAVSDLQLDAILREHPAVAGEPHIRFYAAHPLQNHEGAVIGSVCLVDYVPRTFGEDRRLLLADLAGLVERELQLQSMNALHAALQKKNKSLRRRSLIDPLLKIWNRGAIMRILGIEADRCDKQSVPLSMIVIDLDYFKKINDTYGHQTGDTVLVNIAARLRSCMRPQDALGRYGGEEFLAVLPGACHETALAVAERMRQAVEAQPEEINGVMLKLSISAGISSTVQFPSATTDELISFADSALYAAKDAGRNRVIRAQPENA